MCSLNQHIVGIGKFLEVVPEADRAEIAEKQVLLLEKKLTNTSLQLDKCTEVMESIKALPIATAQRNLLVNALLQGSLQACKPGGRRDNQAWEHCYERIPTSEWQRWQHANISDDEVVEMISKFLHGKGLRLPSELTFGCMASLRVVAAGVTSLDGASKLHMYALLQTTKKVWKSLYPKPLAVSQWHHTYADVPPFSAGTEMVQFDGAFMKQMVQTVPLRNTNSMSGGSSNKAPMNLNLGQNNELATMAQMFGTALHQMQQTQLMTLEAMQGRFGHEGGSSSKASAPGQPGIEFGKAEPAASLRRSTLRLGGSYLGRSQQALTFTGGPLKILQPFGSEPSMPQLCSAPLPPLSPAEPKGFFLEDEVKADEDQVESEAAEKKTELGAPTPRKGKMTLAQCTAMLLGGGPSKEPKKLDPKAKPKAKAKAKKDKKKDEDKKKLEAKAKASPTSKDKEKLEAKAKASPSKAQVTGPKPSKAQVTAAKSLPQKKKLWVAYGCSKCRYRAGCTNSCWTGRKMFRPGQ